MFRKFFLIVALTLSAAAIAPLPGLRAEGTTNLPDWRDGASVYLSTATASRADTPPPGQDPPAAKSVVTAYAPTHVEPVMPPPVDAAVQPAARTAPATAAEIAPARRLAPPSGQGIGNSGEARLGLQSPRSVPQFGLPWQSLTTTLGALAMVIGLLLICTWMLRRGARSGSRQLPTDVVSVLGRMHLAPRNVAQLIRVGNKLVLLSVTSTGVEAITEVTDQAEVDRLIGLCQQSDPHSATKAFEQVFRQMSLEPARIDFFGQDSSVAFRGDAVRG